MRKILSSSMSFKIQQKWLGKDTLPVNRTENLNVLNQYLINLTNETSMIFGLYNLKHSRHPNLLPTSAHNSQGLYDTKMCQGNENFVNFISRGNIFSQYM